MKSTNHNPTAHMPNQAGVYFFKNADGVVIYIGKAKCLKKRVLSYFSKRELDYKINALLSEHASIDYILTGSDIEAQILEARLIKEHRPKYNVLLTDGNPFLYILFTPDIGTLRTHVTHVPDNSVDAPSTLIKTSEQKKIGALPKIKLVRTKTPKEKGVYFGPFIHKKEARSAYAYLLRTFKLHLCTVRLAGGCLDYHLGICAGSCLPQFDVESYKTRLELARHMLEGNFKRALSMLKERISHFSERHEFERAQHFHEYLQEFDVIFQTLKLRFDEKKYATDVFVATTPFKAQTKNHAAGLAELKTLLDLRVSPRIIDCFDISHFQSRHIVGSCVRFKDGLPDKSGLRKFKINSLAQQDDCAALQEIVLRRYTGHHTDDLPLRDQLCDNGSCNDKSQDNLHGNNNKTHSDGSHSAGSPPGRAINRKHEISPEHAEHSLRSSKSHTTLLSDKLPDLILIDGGKGQRNAIVTIMGDCPVPVLSLAKREEHLFTPLHPEGITLDVHSSVGQMLMALRDYAHHFAISYHKKLRAKTPETGN